MVATGPLMPLQKKIIRCNELVIRYNELLIRYKLQRINNSL